MGVKRHAATVETVVVASCNIFHFRFPHTCETQLGKIDMEKKVLVTGDSGFIGSYLIGELSKKEFSI